MINEELVNNIVCKNCRVRIGSGLQCVKSNKITCFIYNSALQVANEKDKQLQKYVEDEVKSFNND